MISYKLVTPPAELPVTLERAKQHLRIEASITDDDETIESLIEAATDYAERFTGRALIDQTWDMFADAFPTATASTGFIEIRKPPLIEVVGVFYADSDDAEQEFGDFAIDGATDPARIYAPSSVSWPTVGVGPSAVRIRFRAGYLDTTNSPGVANVPPAIKHAILLHVGALYEYREDISSTQVNLLPWGAEALLRRYRYDLSLA